MKYEAVIFDLFGTLIKKFSVREHTEILRQMASVVSVPPDDFVQLWSATFNERGSGVFKSIDANIEYICQKCGVPAEDANVKIASQINLDYTKRSIKTHYYATKALFDLKSRGYKTGLISNCSAEIPGIMSNKLFIRSIDVQVFSPLVGIQKPDPRIYQIAAERLVTTPEFCLYIGDGDEYELSGAAQAGMHPVLLRVSSEDSTDVSRVGTEREKWPGLVIASLTEVVNLL